MRKHRLNNIKIFLSIFLFLGVYTLIGTININAENINSNYSQNYDPKIPEIINLPQSQYNIKIIDVTGGFSLKIKIKNVGVEDAYNIEIVTEITGGILLFPKNKNFQIPMLEVGETKILRLSIFGFGLGIFTESSTIKIFLKESNTKILYGKITANVFGFIVKIKEKILNDKNSYQGYTLFGPEYLAKIYLIKNDGEIVKRWESDHIQGLATYLSENGDLYRVCLPTDVNTFFIAGGLAGRVERFNWNGDLIWEFEYSNNQHCSHHDIEILPNGNVLLIAWEYKSPEEAIEAGRDPDKMPYSRGLWPDHIIEVVPTGSSGGNIVWEWHVWDHLIQDFDPTKDNYGNVADHPELIDINYGHIGSDFNHINSIDYNAELDQLLISSNQFCEIWVIDHSTTTEEAAGHSGGNSGKGGDILYRWGNPQTYRAGEKSDQYFYEQHDAQWIKTGNPGEGNILIFNNGNDRPEGRYSSIEEIITPVDGNGNYFKASDSAYEPEEPVWSYIAENPTDFYSKHLSSVQRLPNGNTLICEGTNGYFFEVTFDKEIVWQYEQKFSHAFYDDVFMVRRYPLDYIP
jgi:hypothetical protein